MKSVRLVVEYDAETMHPAHELVCESPRIEREYLLEGRADDGVETILSYVEGDLEPYERTLEATSGLLEYDLRPTGDGGFFVYARSELGDSGRSLERAFDQETIVVVPPIEFRPDRTMRLTLIGHPEDLQATIDNFPPGIDATVSWIGDHAQAVEGRLTDRQREALQVAWDRGYYDVPREGDLETVAEELGITTATASTLLRRAEARLVEDALEWNRQG
ncbi:helix-turn-helix domain-containing protein [Natrialbaceae archaeon AArc-T1-2]|uniref:helix-turn-helix domain-containing protein n=1 Tax=Natrialbaceae archaeon AArc-T1-2 TaxID=3053904 RepID=UPI00255B374C|nr:helix-turn-helix domain-containing protein [Natrialbaceae archaeon AArc-T1-2]WIV66244.1 helix-turn-helix domain-containing protein [Natrialbaceae archaeon AArc-T1-2]